MKLNLGSHDYVQTLKGQKLTFPDFDGLLRDFPTGMSPHYETLKGVINAELKMYVGHRLRDCYSSTLDPIAGVVHHQHHQPMLRPVS